MPISRKGSGNAQEPVLCMDPKIWDDLGSDAGKGRLWVQALPALAGSCRCVSNCPLFSGARRCEVFLLSRGLVDGIEKVGQEGRKGGRRKGAKGRREQRKEEFLCICSGQTSSAFTSAC